ncbi:E3 ubiquitin-protein ligase PRT1-like isoform X2 [Telopea speciosissima]|uniref:E3 ubiquitin-protein ligase PRT1-like isoform X2 n=1 Tax=Telopea speciosissima TaxID=54955 RepID=UPI001CC3E795|nr:E3 ubiquitin-protein ligase PRT1-like isoform X2 [Telopea speciosissima]
MDGEKEHNVSPVTSITTSLHHEILDFGNEDDEEISESFVCCVCLDLLYKPIVLACGHISCFWCVHKAMDGLGDSHCPICRCPYNYFPSICLMLHYLLLKMYPLAYKRREKQVLEEEKESGFFSPQIDDNFSGSHTNELNLLGHCSHSSTGSLPDFYSDSCSTGKLSPSKIEEPLEFNSSWHESEGDTEATKKLADEEIEKYQAATCRQVSAFDVLCAACKQLLFRPAVLNCGHVYCESCIATPGVELLRCQVCQSFHPTGLPKVCLEFDHFLEGQFPEKYDLRREAVHSCQSGRPSASATQDVKQDAKSSFPHKDLFNWLREHGSKVHIGFGCDSCGMFPIIGERYKCKDCMEKAGFDLCGECYNTCSKRPGKFNQQHTPQHTFVLVPPSQKFIRRMLATLSTGGPASIFSSDSSEDSQEAFSDPFHGDALEVPENGSVAPINSYDAPEDQEDDLPVPMFYGDDLEVADNGSGAQIRSDDASEDPENTHTTL